MQLNPKPKSVKEIQARAAQSKLRMQAQQLAALKRHAEKAELVRMLDEDELYDAEITRVVVRNSKAKFDEMLRAGFTEQQALFLIK